MALDTKSDSMRLLHVLVDQFGHFEHAHLFLAVKDSLQLVIRVDHAFVLGVLQVVLLNVGPNLLGNLSPR